MQERVTLTFVLDEEVTPDLFAQRVAQACSSGALRPGEGIELPSDPSKVLYISEERAVDVLRGAGWAL